MLSLRLSSPLDLHSLTLLHRIVKLYKTFIVLSALTGALSIGLLSFPEFHPSTNNSPSSITTTSLIHVSEAFLLSSLISAVVAGMLATMLLFCFEGYAPGARKDLLAAWAPLVLLDWSIVAFLAGMLCWYAEKNRQAGDIASWRTIIMVVHVGALLIASMVIAGWMWGVMNRRNGLSVEEMEVKKLAREKLCGDGSGIGKIEEEDGAEFDIEKQKMRGLSMSEDARRTGSNLSALEIELARDVSKMSSSSRKHSTNTFRVFANANPDGFGFSRQNTLVADSEEL
ncbi:MAG: hypothetical protein M1827_004978 [Pycnora praestabilis]|nr:MAG: hypothetical protein M1827_004978 [Pycnora praestabilis]